MNRLLQFTFVAGLATMTLMAAPSIPLQGTASWSDQTGLPDNLLFSPATLTADLGTLPSDGDIVYGVFILNGRCSQNCGQVNGSFELTLTFTLPPNNSGPVTAGFVVSGHVSQGNGSNNVAINYDPTPHTVTYDNGVYHGSFDVVFDSDDNVAINGLDTPAAALVDISNITYTLDAGQDPAATPEPAVTLLFGTILAGVAFVSKRRFLGKPSR
jgi:hypothetical protein